MDVTPARQQMRLRSVFISDVHLGFRGCRAEYLLHFLDSVEARQIFVIGDLIDFWALRRQVYWPSAHQEVLRKLLTLARTGTRVVYIPGNHDELCRDLCGSQYGPVEVHREYVHETADGRRMLLLHGDEFDEAVKFGAWLKRVGEFAYDAIIRLNHVVHRVRRRLGYGYWSLADWIKRQVPDAVDYIDRFERAAAAEARRRGLDGVICGHIHRPTVRELDGVLYCNDGDWVESCTSLVEDHNGRLAVLRWTESLDRRAATIPLFAPAQPTGAGIPGQAQHVPPLQDPGVAA
jgi:UDP-2,3-diacylglucosamine pyrophosphatase LpxH